MKCVSAVAFSLILVAGAARAGEHAHEHKAPHHGTLVVFGAEFAHLELVLEKDGKLTAYVLDGEAEKAVRIKQKEIEMKLESIDGKKTDVKLKLKAVANVLTGETEGSTSEFSVTAPELKGAAKFHALIPEFIVKGVEFKKVDFAFPEGNEDGHDHGDHKHKKTK